MFSSIPAPASWWVPPTSANFLAQLGIEATAGFAVSYRNLHAADEVIEVASIAPVYDTYRGALRSLPDLSRR